MSVLIGIGALAYTYAAYDEDVSHMWGTLLVTVGLGKKTLIEKETVVTAGSELSINGRSHTLTQLPPRVVAHRIAWAGIHLKGGWIAFRGQTLESVVDEFNRHNVRQLRIADDATGQLVVGGKFRVTDVDGFIAAIAVTHGVRATESAPQGGRAQSGAPRVTVLALDERLRGDGSEIREGASGSARPEEFAQDGEPE